MSFETVTAQVENLLGNPDEYDFATVTLDELLHADQEEGGDDDGLG
jgi:hypothetical protein